MDIREYVIALSVVCRPAKTLETMKLAFKVCCVLSFELLKPPDREALYACPGSASHLLG